MTCLKDCRRQDAAATVTPGCLLPFFSDIRFRIGGLPLCCNSVLIQNGMKGFFQRYLLVLLVSVAWLSVTGQQVDWVQDCALYVPEQGSAFPAFVRFKADARPVAADLDGFLAGVFELGANDRFVLQKRANDGLGFTHETWQHFHDGHPVLGSVIKTHSRAGKLESFNGHCARQFPVMAATLSEAAALSAALRHVGADSYKWEIAGEDQFLQHLKGDPNATFFPKGELTYVMNRGRLSPEPYRLAWRFDIYAHSPASRADVYVDAATGEVIFRNEILHCGDAIGTATTRYSGVQTIVTDSTGNGYRLREATHGGGIETYNCNNTTNYFTATDFTDADNNWDTFSPQIDDAATDAHWGAEMTYEYYAAKHNRDSYDGNGGPIRSYVHYDNGLANANWNGLVMSYGDGTNNAAPFTTLDICGHELTHGVTQYAAALLYQDESGALNESFSDIFGNTIERFARPGQYSWLIAEDFGAFRNMADPQQFGNPDTYQGQYWVTGTFDNGGVHFNSGVQNYWYALLADGGSGTNDNGLTYNIAGIGIDSAAAIAYRNLEHYMTANSQYSDARYGAIQAAIDLFGECSNEMIQTWNAWAAVGLGQMYTGTLSAGFYTADTMLCNFPFVVNFTNQSTSGIHFLWRFGDGTTSTAENPSHTYAFTGTYSVTLIAYGCNGATDTIVFPDRIVIDVNQSCPVNMVAGDTTVTNSCGGTLYDSGGAGDYLPNSSSVFSIQPNNGTQVMLTFTAFEYAAGDNVRVYDGPTTQSPQLGIYSGTTLPPTLVSTNGALTIRESTNGANNRSGFVANWSCFVGAEDGLAGELLIFPNPAADQVRFVWNRGVAEAYSVKVLDGLGRVQAQQTGAHDGAWVGALDVSDLAAGIYVVCLQSGEARVMRKLIVE